jgi:hypothetical protein
MDGRVWGVNEAYQIWTKSGVNATWEIIGGMLKQLNVGIDGRVWGVNSYNQIYTRNGINGTWQFN